MGFYHDYLSGLDYIQESSNNYKGYQTPFNEVYFGKNKYLTDAEKLLGQARQAYKYNQSKINFSREIIAFNRLIEKAFDFEAFSLNIDHSGALNAYTYPLGVVIDAPNMKEISADNKQGFKMTDIRGSTIVVYINAGLLFSDVFTDGEIMAIIMHEIGHNFQTAISPISRGFSYVTRATSLVLLPLIFLINPEAGLNKFKGTRRWYYGLVDRLREEKSGIYAILDGFSYITNKIIGVIGVAADFVISFLAMLAGPAIPIPDINTLINFISSFGGVKDETIADNFATAYGYGPELTSALGKIERKSGGMIDREVIRGIPFIGIWYDLCLFPTNVMNSIIDAHPNKAHRIKSQIDMLRAETNKSELDKKVKAKINREIDTLEEQLDKSVRGLKKNPEVSSNVDESFVFTDAYSAFLLTICNGDLRSFMSKGNIREFDAAYDRALEKVKKNKYKYKF